MKLTQLTYFMTVCQTLNITLAAKECHISQPSLTVAIKNLEQEFGVALFTREKNRISLTPEGQHLKERLAAPLRELDDLKREMQSIGTGMTTLKVGVPPMIGSFLFPVIFSGFLSEHPEVKLEIIEYGALRLQQLLLDEKIDLTFLIDESQLNREVIFTPISEQAIQLHIHKTHPLASKETILLEDLDGLPLVIFNSEFYMNQVIKEAFHRKGLSPNIILETNQINTISRFITEDLAGGLLIDGCLSASDAYTTIPLEEIPPISIGIGSKKDRFMTKNAEKMMRFFHKRQGQD